eukprot:gene18406-23271_t
MLLNATGLARFSRLSVLRSAMDKHHPLDRPHDYLWARALAHAFSALERSTLTEEVGTPSSRQRRLATCRSTNVMAFASSLTTARRRTAR